MGQGAATGRRQDDPTRAKRQRSPPRPALAVKQVNGKAFNGMKSATVRRSRRPAKEGDEEILESSQDDDEARSRESSVAGGSLSSAPESDESDNAREDIDEKRRRLAKSYLAELSKNAQVESQDYDAYELDRELIADRLSKDALEHTSKFHLLLADSVDTVALTEDLAKPARTRRLSRFLPRAQTTCTAVAIDPSGKFVYAASKDGHILKVACKTGHLVTVLKARMSPALATAPHSNGDSVRSKGKARDEDGQLGHRGAIVALAISSDGGYLASGGDDRRIGIWDLQEKVWVGACGGHKGQITSLGFRIGTHELYSASLDRTVKLWNISPPVLAYVDTLFGHQDAVTDLKVLSTEACVTAGSRDKTTRYWKILEETQLVFRAGQKSRVREVIDDPGLLTYEGMRQDENDMDGFRYQKTREVGETYIEGSVDAVAMIDDQHFLSGGDSGAISLWHTGKKKAIFTYALAHGLDRHTDTGEGVGGPGGSVENPRWITALAVLPFSDLFVSGSWSGQIRLWQIDSSLKAFRPLADVPIPGVVNALHITSVRRGEPHRPLKGRPQEILVAAALGREPRLGRWFTRPGPSGVLLLRLPRHDALPPQPLPPLPAAGHSRPNGVH